MSDFQKISIVGPGEFDSNGNLTVVVKYESSDATTAGIGFRVYYDSTSMTLTGVSQDVVSDAVAVITTAPTDASDPSMVMHVAGYGSLYGNWPGTTEADLYTLTFTQVVDGPGNTGVYLSDSPSAGAAAGFTFISDNPIPEPPLEITVNPIAENSGENQVIATVANGTDGATYSLVDNTNYGGGDDGVAQAPITIAAPTQAADTQHVYVSAGSLSEDGSQLTVTLGYLSDDPTTTGVGFKLQFDSSVFTLNDVTMIAGDVIAAGNLNDDGDSLTFGFASLFGSWPGSSDTDLTTIVFDVAAAASGSTMLDIVETSSAAGYTFDGQGHTVQLAAISPLSIDAATGDVTLTVNPDYESVPVYSFDVVADGGARSGSANAGITNVDEVAPVFEETSVTLDITENSGAGQVIHTAEADDSADASAGLEYSLSGADADAFNINSGGEVTLIADPDFESQSSYSFVVEATDNVDGHAAAQQTVTLNVIDVDNTAPVITSSADAGSIEENSGAGQAVYTAIASDETSSVTYSLSGDDAGAFSINSDGVVTLTGDPDYETQASYSFNVVATDDAGNASGQAVSLSVDDVFEANPVFAETPDPAITENTVFAYTAVATIQSEVALTYSLSDDFGGIFSIDATTGVVSMSVSPDYEAGINYSFTVVVADDAGNSAEKTVSLTVNNVDDSSPAFIQDSVIADPVVENTGADQVIYTASADDSADISDGVTYSFYGNATSLDTPDLVEDTQHLYVSQATLSENDSKLTLVVSYNSLNVETTGLGLRVHFDSSSLSLNSLSETLNADLIFTNSVPTADTDDLDSIANTDTYIDAGWASMNGNWPTGNLPTELLTLTFDVDPAADASTDIGFSSLASPVGVHFAGHSQPVSVTSNIGNTLGVLSIDTNTGEVTLADNPDYETTSEYDFTVLATDVAGNQSNPQSVVVPISDETIAINSSEIAQAINENIGANQVVYTTTVSGAENDDQITYSLLTSVDQQTGGIEQRFVENQDGSITLQLFVSPSIVGNYPSSIENFDLVLNYNESEITAPVLSLASEIATDATGTELSVIEETVTGEIKIAGIFLNDLPNIQDNPIVEIDFEFKDDIASTEFTVSDVLLGVDNTVLDQSVSRHYDSRGFTIDANTGEVSIVNNPDHESQVDYIFTVMATDAARGQSDIQTVRLSVNDLDDAIPTMTSVETVTAIDENSGASQVIYTATATDTDDITDGFTFSLVAGSDSALTIDAVSGEVMLTDDPDHETQSEYNFEVIATDAAGNVSESLVLTLNINDLDDTAPEITSSDTLSAIDENTGAAQIIYAASADDSLDVSGGVTFSLAEGSDAGLTIDANSGEVVLTANPDYETQTLYSFAVIATDAAGNVSETQSLSIEINNLDEEKPEITSGGVAINVVENSSAGQLVYTATATDSADISHGVTFSLTDDGDGNFIIDSASGEVTFTAQPDYEAQASYSFSVAASDDAGNVSDIQTVSMQVDNIDEVRPTITSAQTADTIDENSGAGQVIYTASAEDTDYNGQQVIEFSLADSSDDVFSIYASSGDVTLAIDPDYETQNQFSFTVIAKDASGNTSESQIVNLSIDDLDDFSLAGNVYHWGTQALMDNVTVSMHSAGSGDHVETVSTSTSGDYLINELASDQVIVTVERELQDEDHGRFITSLDALAALKMAVGRNPNAMDNTGSDQIDVSAYQFIAADVNKNGRVTSADALEILRMAVRVPTATEREWLFVDESEDFWDETANGGEGAISINRTSVSWDSDGVEMPVNQAEQKNFVGVLLGDVYSSWRSPQDAQIVEYDHFVGLEDAGTAPMSQWGMDPQDFSIKSSASADAIFEAIGTNQVIYTITTSDSSATFSLGAASDSALFVVDANTGEVSLVENPDYDQKSQYSFEVIATNDAGDSLSQIVSLSILELDESIPVFDSGDIALAIDENSGENQVVYTANAEHSDSNLISGPMVYSLIDDSNGAFTIDASLGSVSLVNNPDAEASSSLSFTVRAVNSENNFADQTVSLEINNLDDTAPTIVSNGSVSVDENIGENQVVYTANADDSSDISGGVTYSLVDHSAAVSQINVPELLADTQHVYVSESTKSDDGTQETVVISYNADTITSTGLGLQIHFDSTVLGIDSLSDVLVQDNIFAFNTPIDDIDDDDGDATTDSYLSIAWASMMGTWPGTVPTAIATITFNILDGSANSSTINLATSGNATGYDYDGQTHEIAIDSAVSALSIDSITGEVTLAENPDFEITSDYSFDITATDAAGNQSQAQLVSLNINDIDESPQITSSNTEVAIEGSGSDQVVYTATSNIDGATFSLVDNTVYPAIAVDAEPAVTVVTIPELVADTQHVYVSESTKSEDGTQAIVKVSYNADDSTLTGLGLRIHFDSSTLSLSDISDVLNSDLFIPPTTTATADSEDFDNDASTDSYVLVSWTSLFGSWPNGVPADLMTMTFDIAAGATGLSAINFTSSSNAAGFAFDGQQHNVAAVEASSDASDSSDTLESVVSIPELDAGTQHVYVSESTKSEDGTKAVVTLSYMSDDDTTTGIGFKLQFDEAQLTLDNVELITSSDNIAGGALTTEGGISSLSFGYASLFGGWPGSTSVDLATVTFDIVDGAIGPATLDIVQTSNAAGFAFDGQSHEVAISAESESSESESSGSSEAEIMASQLSIDSNSGEVTLAGEADYQTVPDYNFTVTADNGTDSASQTIGLLVADQLVSSGADVYTGTDDADVFALADGSAQVTSGAGADIFVIAPSEEESADTSAMHTLVDFESGVDSIDISALLTAAGYTDQSSLTQLADTDISADILDLINADDSSLDNMFGGAFDDTSNVLTLFVDSDAEVGATQIESVEIELGDSSVINEDDIVVSFIA